MDKMSASRAILAENFEVEWEPHRWTDREDTSQSGKLPDGSDVGLSIVNPRRQKDERPEDRTPGRANVYHPDSGFTYFDTDSPKFDQSKDFVEKVLKDVYDGWDEDEIDDW